MLEMNQWIVEIGPLACPHADCDELVILASNAAGERIFVHFAGRVGTKGNSLSSNAPAEGGNPCHGTGTKGNNYEE